MGTYDQRQINKCERRMNNIRAFKILKITDKGIIIPLPKEFGDGKTTEIDLGDKGKKSISGHKYADITLSYTVYQGKVNNYMAKFWGPTPPEFVPKDGRNISK